MRSSPVLLSPPAIRLLAAAGALVALLLAAQAFPAAVRLLFCAPSAWLGSQFLGAPLVSLANGYRLDCPGLPVDITLACSGATFFALLSGLLLHRALPRAAASLGALGLAYAITVVANTARIVLCWHAAVWAHASLPPSYHSGVHLAVGIIVFSGFLTAGALLVLARLNNRTTP